ncbi:tRNA 2'-phosphotransferase 1-like isoform X2 [Macrosteles quadrilineatus]|uniref:tRNA 2'-phosphotransferase 1-like isoform X2 n=1 Tax=Macrosteles quadrilineatus TaxID=74068 RepID=UPI0023E28B63|nr:tRNA 2'-phosphotransferase 1-like isoform X2 [Macrosteles quadrilineatus]
MRHGAHKENLPISSDGFLAVEHVLKHKQFNGKCSVKDIEHIVMSDAKKRYTLRTDANGKLEVKANQGHSMKMVLSSTDLPMM